MISRKFKGVEDYKKISAFLGRMHKEVSLAGYLHYGDLVYRINVLSNKFDLDKDIRIWTENDEIIGFAIYTTVDANPEFQIQPEYYDLVGDDMIKWAIKRGQELGHDKIETSCIDADTVKADFLKSRDFVLFDDPFVFMVCEIENKTWQYNLPEGYEIHKRADYKNLSSTVFKLSDIGEELVDADLDLRVIYKGHMIASGCTCWYDSINQSAQFEPVDTHEEHRCKGLAYSVMARTMENLKAYGVTTVYVKTSKCNTPAIKLYEKLGFEITNEDLGYSLNTNRSYRWQ